MIYNIMINEINFAHASVVLRKWLNRVKRWFHTHWWRNVERFLEFQGWKFQLKKAALIVEAHWELGGNLTSNGIIYKCSVCLRSASLSGGKRVAAQNLQQHGQLAVWAPPPSGRSSIGASWFEPPPFESVSAQPRLDDRHRELVLRRTFLLRRRATKPWQLSRTSISNFSIRIYIFVERGDCVMLKRPCFGAFVSAKDSLLISTQTLQSAQVKKQNRFEFFFLLFCFHFFFFFTHHWRAERRCADVLLKTTSSSLHTTGARFYVNHWGVCQSYLGSRAPVFFFFSFCFVFFFLPNRP